MNFASRTFIRWLQTNRHRFIHQPILAPRKRDILQFRFKGLSSRLVLSVGNGGSAVWVLENVSRNASSWDVLYFDGDVAPKKIGANRYICVLCDPQLRDVFSSRGELFEKHCFEKTLTWCNKNLKPEKWIVLCALMDGGSTWAEIRDEADVHELQCAEYFHGAFRIGIA